MIELPGRHRRRGGSSEREQGARVRVHRPVPVLLVKLERRANHAGRGIGDEHVERPCLLDDPNRLLGIAEVAAQEDGLRAERA